MRKILLGLLVVLLGFGAFLFHIGYFSSRVFTLLPAQHAPAAPLKGVAVVLFSGDMGSHIGMAPKVAERLSADGIPVVAVSSLVYYRTKRPQQEATALIVQAMQQALAIPGVDKVILVGQSFGADMLHVGLVGLDPQWRAQIPFIALIVPGDTVNYQVSFMEAVGLEKPDAMALPTASKLTWVPAICIWGEQETDSLCPKLTLPNIARQPLSGNHHLSHNSYRLTRVLEGAMVRALQVRAGALAEGSSNRNTNMNAAAPSAASKE